MRKRPAHLLVLFASLGSIALLGSEVGADPREVASVGGFIYPTSACPGATHEVRFCPDSAPSAFLTFPRDHSRGPHRGPKGTYGTVRGAVDHVTCAPLPLIQVQRVVWADVLPPCE